MVRFHTTTGSDVAGTKASRRPVRLKFDRLPPEAVAQVKWGQQVVSALRKGNAKGEASGDPTWRRAVWCLRHGFLPRSYEFYRLDRNDWREYVTDRQREMTWVLNWPYAGILDDKLGFDAMLRRAGAPTPEFRALILHGRLQPLDERRTNAGEDWWRERLDELGRLVLKPIWGGLGGGIKVLERSAAGCRVNGEEVTLAGLRDRVARMDRYVVSEFAQQAAYAQEIFPAAANTLRVLTVHDEHGAPFIAAAAQRFGTQRSSGPVDNVSSGGLCAFVDQETGVLSDAVGLAEYGHKARYDRHPDTGAPISGTRVANWDMIRAGVLDVAAKLPFLPYVGWDVVSTDAGYLIMEGNKQSDVALLQTHRPLLRDPRVRAFYEREGIL